MGEGRNLYRDLVENFERKKPLGRPRRSWEDGIRLVGAVWSGFAGLRIGTVMNLRFLASRN
jgi:hypothetical protein